MNEFTFYINLDNNGYQTKPSGEIGSIKNRLAKASRSITMRELETAIENGQSFTSAELNGKKSIDFVSQQLFCVDIDNSFYGATIKPLTIDDAIKICNDEFVSIANIYYSFSHTTDIPKYRIVFLCDEVITQKNKAEDISKALISLFKQEPYMSTKVYDSKDMLHSKMCYQVDTACYNVDRVFFGTNKGFCQEYKFQENVRFNSAFLLQKYYYKNQYSKQNSKPDTKLQDYIPNKSSSRTNSCINIEQEYKNFDFLSYIKSLGNFTERKGSHYIKLNPCPICGHNDDFTFYPDTNMFACYSTSNPKGESIYGNINNFLQHTMNLNRNQARDYFLYDLLGYERQSYNSNNQTFDTHTTNKKTEWNIPKNLSSSKTNLENFPIDAFPSYIKDYVQANAIFNQVNIDMPSVTALGLIAICNQGKYKVEPFANIKNNDNDETDKYLEPLSLYIVFMGSPGERKTNVINFATDILDNYQNYKNDLLQPDIEEFKFKNEVISGKLTDITKDFIKTNDTTQKLELEKKKEQLLLEKSLLVEVKPLKLYLNQFTPEVFIRDLRYNNNRMAIVDDEGDAFGDINGRYSQIPNLGVFLKGHSGSTLKINRIKFDETLEIYKPSVSILLGVQPQVITEILDNNVFDGRGLLARFLYSAPKSTRGTRVFEKTNAIPTHISNTFKNNIFKLLDTDYSEPKHLFFEDDAFKSLQQQFHHIEKSFDNCIDENWLSKWFGATIRIAGNLHLAEGFSYDVPISFKTVVNAIKIANYFKNHSDHVFGNLADEKLVEQAEYVLIKIKKIYSEQQYNYTIHRETLKRKAKGKGIKIIEDLINVLNFLEEYGYIKQVTKKSESNYNESFFIEINPLYFDN